MESKDLKLTRNSAPEMGNSVEGDSENGELLSKQSFKQKATETVMKNKIKKLNQILRLPNFTRVVNSNGKIVAPSSEIYKELSNAMDEQNRMRPKYIYTMLLENRYSVYSELLSFLNIQEPIQGACFDDSTLNSSGDFHEFRLNVTEIWPSLKPESVIYKFKNRDRILRTLRKNSWTHVLFEEIQNFTNLPCALNFKNTKISESGSFITVHALCSVQNFDPSVNHKKKRPLQGKLRTAVANKLIERNLLPCQHRRNEAHRLIQTVGDESPPQLSRKEIFGKAKQEAINQQLGTTGSNVYENLLILKYSDKYGGAIRNIGLDPPFVHYWTKEQQLIYEKFPEILKIDATGSVVKPIVLPNGEKCSHIYLFQAVAEVNGKTIPVFQMLSAAQTTVAILNWLLEFLRVGSIEKQNYPLPLEVVTDFDKALLGVVSRAYGRVYSLQQYLNLCFRAILGEEVDFPICILRLDVCHYTQMIARWKCYPKHQPGVRSLYIRAMCILRNQEDFHDFEEIAIAILTLSLSKNGNEGSLAFNARTFLVRKIRGISNDLIDEVLNNQDKFDTLEEHDLSFEESEQIEFTTLGEWVQRVYDKVTIEIENEEVNDDDDVNGYQLPAFGQKLKVLLFYFPIFTEIIRKLRGYGTVNATSAASESYFHDLKNRAFRALGLPLRLDKFIAGHILEIEKFLKEAAAGSIVITKYGNVEAVIKNTKMSRKQLKRKINDDENFKTMAEVNKKDIYNEKKKNQQGITKKTNVSARENYSEISKARTNENSTQHWDDEVIELNNEHNWRNKNKKIIGMEQAAISDESEEEEICAERINESELRDDLDDDVEHSFLLDSRPYPSVNGDDLEKDILKVVSDFKDLQEYRNKKKPKQKGALYGEPCPQFEPTQKKITWLPILPNGGRCKNVRERSTITVLSNTCAFDSLLQLVSMAIITHEFYQPIINDVTSDIFTCAKTFIKNKIGAAVYKERARILRDSPITVKEIKQYKRQSDKLMYNIVKVNAECNISDLAHSLFSKTPSYEIKYTCTICKSRQINTYIEAHIDLPILKVSGIKNLRDALKLPPTKEKGCCNERLSINVCYGSHLLINTDIGISNEVCLHDIPKRLKVDSSIEYQVAGFVEYQGSYDPTKSGHYVGYVSVGTYWLQYDDLSSSKSPHRMDNAEKVDPHILLYVKM